MPAGDALLPIYRAIRALLVADGTLTGLIATAPAAVGGGPGVYAEGAVPPGATLPYLTLGAGTQVPDHTMGGSGSGRWGWNCTVQLKAVSQGKGDDQALGIMGAAGQVLYDNRPLTVTGYTQAACDEWNQQPTIITTVAAPAP